MDLGEKIWKIVLEWNRLVIDTVGKQLIKPADSIAANISKGFGRYHNKEIRHFCIFQEVPYLNPKHGLQKLITGI